MELLNIGKFVKGDTTKARVFSVEINETPAAIASVRIDIYKERRLVKTFSGDDFSISSGQFTLLSHTVELPVYAYIYGCTVTLDDGSIRTWFGGLWTVLEPGQIIGRSRPYIPFDQVAEIVGATTTEATPTSVGDDVTITVNDAGDQVDITVSTGESFVDPMTSIGDIIYRDENNITTRLPIGLLGQALSVVEESGSLRLGYSTPSGSGDMLKSENLSGLADVAISRTNLGIPVYIYGEIPSGTIDGSNATFTTQYAFVPESLQVFLNGHRQRAGAGNDFINTDAQTVQMSESLVVGDVLVFDYQRA